MANERTYPCLPCRDVDESIAFYENLGFKRTYRQLRPNPYAVVQYEDIHLHIFGMDGFEPENSYGMAIVVVPDTDALYRHFAERLRAAFGKLPVTGLPRVTRPRKKFGTVSGFSLVDPGGNWLRISQMGDSEEDEEKAEGLQHFIEVATRLGDAAGREADAMRTLQNALARYPESEPVVLARAYLYRAELAVRLKDEPLAKDSLSTLARLTLSAEAQEQIADELAHVTTLVNEFS
ncbi:MAG TPA: VOC family protein [Anaerolineales bacterium]|nr:VOC family protein [Anaerolineales bacterium]HRQ92916.1 VOC family protein [Anaerolineales bacterium]